MDAVLDWGGAGTVIFSSLNLGWLGCIKAIAKAGLKGGIQRFFFSIPLKH